MRASWLFWTNFPFLKSRFFQKITPLNHQGGSIMSKKHYMFRTWVTIKGRLLLSIISAPPFADIDWCYHTHQKIQAMQQHALFCKAHGLQLC